MPEPTYKPNPPLTPVQRRLRQVVYPHVARVYGTTWPLPVHDDWFGDERYEDEEADRG